MKEEVEIIQSWMSVQRTEMIANRQAYIGTWLNTDIVLIESGIGKVNASIITTLLIEKYNVNVVINTGVAGALREVNVTDIVISEAVMYHDVDATEFGYEFGQMPSMPKLYFADEDLIKRVEHAVQHLEVKSKTGLILCGDSFIGNRDQKEQIISKFKNGLSVDMESAAIAQTCYQFEVPFVIIRSISDNADQVAELTYEEFLAKACIHSSEVVKLLVQDL